MSDTEQQIRKKYAEWYPDVDDPVSDEDISTLIDHECKCDSCNISIFELDDFPEVNQKHDFVLCEECYDEEYREICPICEDFYDTLDGDTDYFVINEEASKELKHTPGIYKILERPFFYGDIISGFDNFYPESIELVTPIRINEYKQVDVGDGFQEVTSGHICPDCIEKFTKKDRWITLENIPCLLMNSQRNFFSDYSDEQIHLLRQKLIHKRITLRGMMEQATDRNFNRKERRKQLWK